MNFRVAFNGGRQYFLVHLDLSLRYMLRRHKAYAWYIAEAGRKKRHGIFGHIHLPYDATLQQLQELIPHEVQHLVFDWLLCRKGGSIGEHNEEMAAIMIGDITKRFWREYRKAIKKPR